MEPSAVWPLRVRLPTYWESVYDNARFTLAYYLRKAPAHAASPDEAAAVQALLDLFKSFARAGS